MSIRNLKEWPEIVGHVRIETYAPDGGHKNPRFRLEFKASVTQEQKQRWVGLEAQCVACGATIHPIRVRKSGGRDRGRIGHLYIAPCCPLSVSVGCSRGAAAHEEYLAIRKEVEHQT